MRKILFVALCFLAFSVQAKPSQEDIQFCGALSTYVHAVSENKLNRVPKELAYDTLLKQNGQIAPSLIPGINAIIEVVYDDSTMRVTTAAQRAAIIGQVYNDCLKQRK